MIAISKRTNIVFFGLFFMVSSIYISDILYVSRLVPDRDNQYENRPVPQLWRNASEAMWDTMLCLALPAWTISKLIYEPYYGELVYYPLLAGGMWFAYGCLLRWAYVTKRFRKVLIMLTLLWAVLLYLGYVAHHW